MFVGFALAASLHRGPALAAASGPFLHLCTAVVSDYATRLRALAAAQAKAGGAGAKADARGQPQPRSVARQQPKKGGGLFGCCGSKADLDVVDSGPAAMRRAEAGGGAAGGGGGAEAAAARLSLMLNQCGFAVAQLARLADKLGTQLPAIRRGSSSHHRGRPAPPSRRRRRLHQPPPPPPTATASPRLRAGRCPTQSSRRRARHAMSPRARWRCCSSA